LLSLNRFPKICTARKRMKFATKPSWHYPPHLRNVATLLWKIKTSDFLQILKKKQTNCILITFTFVIHPQTLVFSVFKIVSISACWLQIKFPMSLFFVLFRSTYLLWRSICGIGNSSPQTSLQFLLTINMILSHEDKILIKSLYLKGYTAKRLTGEFPEKSWTKRGVNKQYGTQAQLTGGQAVAVWQTAQCPHWRKS